MSTEPAGLVADEPTGGLTVETAQVPFDVPASAGTSNGNAQDNGDQEVHRADVHGGFESAVANSAPLDECRGVNSGDTRRPARDQAPARDRLAATLLGEHAVVGLVELDETAAGRNWYRRGPCRAGACGRQLKIGSCVKLQRRIVGTGSLAAEDTRTASGS